MTIAAVFLIALGSILASPTPALAGTRAEQQLFSLEPLQAYDGAVIHSITLNGLRWTRPIAVRWLLSQHEGDVFNGKKWLTGIHKLYDTTILYNIQTGIRPVEGSVPRQIDIEMSFSDRWSLMPYGIAQAGGGSNNIGGGIFEANAFGLFAQLSASYSEFDHVGSYDLNYYQEFFMDTNLMLGLDVSNIGLPENLQSNHGDGIGAFTWDRQQEQVLFGEKLPGDIRLFSYFEYFRDHMVENQGAPEVYVYQQAQYRIRPTLIQGRSELTNFLEEGHEFTLAPTTANFFEGRHSYSQLVMTYKKVYLHQNTNYAYFINVGAMDYAPIPYLFHLGGYDTVRGYSTFRAVGRYYVNNNLEYRPYLMRFSLPLLGEIVTQGCLFQDFGEMWNSTDLTQTQRVNSRIALLSEGAGLRFNLMRFAGAIGRIDLARTIAPDEGWGLSLGVGQFF